jgi:hypothetical protein
VGLALAKLALAIGLVEPEGLPVAASSTSTSTSAPGGEGPSVPELVSPAAEAVVLTWEAPAGCPEAAAVRRAIAGYLGGGPTAEAGASVRAVARVTRGGGRYRLALETQTASGVTVREATSEDCAVLVDATAVIVAIAVDPSTVLGRGDAAPKPVEPEPEPSEPSEPVEPIEPELEPSEPAVDPEPTPLETVVEDGAPEPTPSEPRVRFGVRVSGGLDFGVLPGLAGGLRLAAAVFGGRSGVGRRFGRAWRAELRGDFWFPRTASVQEGIGGRVSLWSLGGRGCWVPGVARVGLEFPLCAGLESGAMHGEPVGARVASPTPSNRFWLAADGSAGLAWAPRRFIALVIQAELVVPLVRAGFRVGDVPVHVTGPVAGRALLGLEARFP